MNIPDYIKPGAFVRLHDGRKAEIYSTDNGLDYPIHGRVFNSDGTSSVLTWSNNGEVFKGYSQPKHPSNITGPWVERPDYSKLWPILPPWIKWLARDADGELFGYLEKPHLSKTCWRATIGGHLRIPPAYHPPAVGDWEDSLQERPTP